MASAEKTRIIPGLDRKLSQEEAERLKVVKVGAATNGAFLSLSALVKG